MPDFAYWWLVAFPLFFGLGWLAARIDIRHLLLESKALPRSYFKGLNFLLNEQPDKAIEAFIEVVKIEPETVELHFALGSLFRRRGETERAIRMHQNLVDRTDLKQEQKLMALFELGQDFLKAGLLDRAEALFSTLLNTSYDQAAKKFLLEIYQLEKDWLKAIAMARELPPEAGKTWDKEIAEFFCELAAIELAHSRLSEVRRYLQEAIVANRKCVRASILLGDLNSSEAQIQDAIEAWKYVESQDPAYLALVAQKLVDAYGKLGNPGEALILLRDYLERFPSLDLLDVAFQSALAVEGVEAAYTLVRDELRRNPTLLGLDHLLEAQVMAATPERRHDLELVKNLVHSHTRRLARYRCEGCGFKARQFYWHCPGCGSWETYPPRRAEEFDLTP